MAKTFTKTKYVKAFIISGIVALFIANIIILGTRTGVIYIITSSDSSTFSISDDKISFIIDNDIDNLTKIMNIYGITNNDNLAISSSNLIEDISGKIIRDNDILFNNTSTLSLQNISQGFPLKVDISINNNNQPIDNRQTGLYRGQFFIKGDIQSSIPITVDIKPTLDQVIIWVINGIAIAIIFWKFVKFFNERFNLKLNEETRSFEQKWEENPLTFTEFLKKRRITSGTIAKNAILDIGSIAFGIVIGLLALINNEFIIGIRILDVLTIIFLIGIGLGIGSLKEYVYQASEPNKPASS